MSNLLPFQTEIVSQIHDPATSDLLVIARGLGLRRIICTLLKIYDSPENLILLVNATQEEETEIGEELNLMGCRKPGLRVVGYETGTSKDRQDLYKKGGLLSVTSRILVVDMLQGDISIDRITGILVLHAEKVSPLHLVSFINRLYREKNKDGFLKAFTDQPEHITSGISPLKNVMKELGLRRVSIWPRFHQTVKDTLERRRADVIELSQNLTDSMADIHGAIVQCMTNTLNELRRSRADLDLDILSLPTAYFPSFDHIVRKQLDPVWHKVGWSTKALVRDLSELRRLVGYLLTYDAVQFHSYCETLINTNSPDRNKEPGGKSTSEWMFTDAAHTVFETAKRRCHIQTTPVEVPPADPDDHEEEWAILDELEGWTPAPKAPTRPKWLPANMHPVLEELPKWSLLVEVIEEIEYEILKMEGAFGPELAKPLRGAPGTNTTLVMCSSTATASVLTTFLGSIDKSRPKGEWGRRMMMKKMSSWLWWKSKREKEKELERQQQQQQQQFAGNKGKGRGSGLASASNEGISPALMKKDQELAKRMASRRRVRGGAPSQPAQPPPSKQDIPDLPSDALWAEGDIPLDAETAPETLNFSDIEFSTDLSKYYGLISAEETVLIRAYSDDTDDRMLEELKPRFIIMFEPCMEFVRRIEVYKSSHPGLPLRVYHMVYTDSCEEHKYLAGIRREKESFERLIKEKGTMMITLEENRSQDDASDMLLRTINTRIAGGRRELNTQPSQVIVDMREFRSTLPSLLHLVGLKVIPGTLTVGDYILSPDICVERKSLSDLVSSFNSGRLYSQCELMSVHYKIPVLLIEFEEDKAFSLEIISEMKSYATKKNAKKQQPTQGNSRIAPPPSIQSKLVLLLLSFPRLKIVWSSSPHFSSSIFVDLKKDRAEPDLKLALSVGAEPSSSSQVEPMGINAAAEELLRTIPGINEKNAGYVMSKVASLREFCELSLSQVKEILGDKPGKDCWEFMHKGDRIRG